MRPRLVRLMAAGAVATVGVGVTALVALAAGGTANPLHITGGDANGNLSLTVPSSATVTGGKVSVTVSYSCSEPTPTLRIITVGLREKVSGYAKNAVGAGEVREDATVTCDSALHSTTIQVPSNTTTAFAPGVASVEYASIMVCLGSTPGSFCYPAQSAGVDHPGMRMVLN